MWHQRWNIPDAASRVLSIEKKQRLLQAKILKAKAYIDGIIIIKVIAPNKWVSINLSVAKLRSLSTAFYAKRPTSSTHSKPKSNTWSSLNGLKVKHRSQLLRIAAKCSAMRRLSLTLRRRLPISWKFSRILYFITKIRWWKWSKSTSEGSLVSLKVIIYNIFLVTILFKILIAAGKGCWGLSRKKALLWISQKVWRFCAWLGILK